MKKYRNTLTGAVITVSSAIQSPIYEEVVTKTEKPKKRTKKAVKTDADPK